MIYVDSNNTEWREGTINNKKNEKKESEYIIETPIYVKCMYPVTEDNDIYCSCIKCGSFIEEGVLCLEFIEKSFGTRVSCISCCKEYNHFKPSCIIITNITNKIENLIRNIDRVENVCQICEKKNCNNTMCDEIKSTKMIYYNEIEQQLELLYRQQVNIIKPLLYHPPFCELCDKPAEYCGNCYLFAYCSKSCKKRDKHICKPYYDVWRTYI